MSCPWWKSCTWYQGTTIEAMYRLACRSPADRVQIIRCLEILERQTERIIQNPQRAALDDAMVKADRLADIARMSGSKGKGVTVIPRSRLLRQTATIVRTAADYNGFGEWVEGQPVETEAACVSQPDTGIERDLEEEGARSVGRRFFWFKDGVTEIQLASASAGHATDQIRYR